MINMEQKEVQMTKTIVLLGTLNTKEIVYRYTGNPVERLGGKRA